jgi:hypothetical protein
VEDVAISTGLPSTSNEEIESSAHRIIDSSDHRFIGPSGECMGNTKIETRHSKLEKALSELGGEFPVSSLAFCFQ